MTLLDAARKRLRKEEDMNYNVISPHETQNPDEFVTEICYPEKKK